MLRRSSASVWFAAARSRCAAATASGVAFDAESRTTVVSSGGRSRLSAIAMVCCAAGMPSACCSSSAAATADCESATARFRARPALMRATSTSRSLASPALRRTAAMVKQALRIQRVAKREARPRAARRCDGVRGVDVETDGRTLEREAQLRGLARRARRGDTKPAQRQEVEREIDRRVVLGQRLAVRGREQRIRDRPRFAHMRGGGARGRVRDGGARAVREGERDRAVARERREHGCLRARAGATRRRAGRDAGERARSRRCGSAQRP